jgi:hypothetical protein
MQYPAETLSFEYRLIEDIIKEYPQSSEIFQRYFGWNCLRWPSFKIQTIGMACMLFGVNQKQLLQEFEKVQH